MSRPKRKTVKQEKKYPKFKRGDFWKRKPQSIESEDEADFTFEEIVEKAVKDFPLRLRKAVRNLEIIVEDEPSADLLSELGHDPKQPLLGLYVGVPLPERSLGEEPYLPDQILIFRKPLERMCRNTKELREQIRITIVHELAHYFGFDEDYLEELGLG